MRLFLLFLALMLLFAVPLFVFGERFDAAYAGSAGVERLRAHGPMAGLAGMLLLVADLVLPIPSTPVMAALGLIYGPWLGGLYGAAGLTLGGAAAYGATRLMGPRAAVFLIGPRDLERARRFFERGGGLAVAASRALPLLAEVIACLAGLSGMPARRFFLALPCGALPVAFFYASVGAALERHQAAALLIGALAPVPLYLVARRILEPPAR